jgi:RimJ/RimL family protein N-acetyltransferase
MGNHRDHHRVIELEGRKVRLRDWREKDLDSLRSLLDPVRRWHDTNGPYFGRMSPEDADAVAARIAALTRTDPGSLPWPRESAAIAELDTDRLVGQASWYWECQQTDWRRLGLIIYDERCWGRGYGTEALRLWTSYLFAATDALRLDFATYSGNPAMIAVGRRLGFTEEGRFRQARRWSGGIHDSVVLGVLREEWQNLHSPG